MVYVDSAGNLCIIGIVRKNIRTYNSRIYTCIKRGTGYMGSGRKTLQGLFTPIFPEKYKGNVKQIVYRSSWELAAMSRFDRDVRIKWWSSEELIIEYYNPVKQRIARYFPDFVIGVNHGNGVIRTIVIEVKPAGECKPPTPPKNKNAKRRERYISECATFATNQAKWDAAKDYCQRKGYTFQIMDEYSLGIKKRPQ